MAVRRVGTRVETMDDSELPPPPRLDPGFADCAVVSADGSLRLIPSRTMSATSAHGARHE